MCFNVVIVNRLPATVDRACNSEPDQLKKGHTTTGKDLQTKVNMPEHLYTFIYVY